MMVVLMVLQRVRLRVLMLPLVAGELRAPSQVLLQLAALLPLHTHCQQAVHVLETALHVIAERRAWHMGPRC